ncbi:ubiquitin hydrolase [Trypanosoma conorhini]|uniref:Ubiquitin hydrolase n=1 Tax=Trypanosoma conorhini TaxID=83891 RepID=A0A422QB61_9TRYP|nr:ubiquitin hydrolase [Trypanosoma conorhini]RNF27211.1 ubiquitin hydrolase [Trypanosoma conorhini]
MSNERVLELLRQRRMREVEILLLDPCGSGKSTSTGSISVDAEVSDAEMQDKIYKHLCETQHSAPASAEHICFQYFNPHARQLVDPTEASLLFPSSTIAGSFDFVWPGGEQRKLFVTLLPIPWRALDKLRTVLFNVGGGIRPTVYIEARPYKLAELFRLAQEQAAPCLPDDICRYMANGLKEGIPVLRLISGFTDRTQRVHVVEDEELPQRGGVYVVDVLAELRPGFSRVNVVFYGRRSGEGQLDFPTNIALTDGYEETGEEIVQRVVAKIRATASAEEVGRWIVAVRGGSGVTRTVGPKEVLKRVMQEIDEKLECLTIDRPRSSSRDGVGEARQGVAHSIVI